ncbi:bifunctional metallophosphatase/5'-nucleotidase [Photobacterium indicum]|uniref:Bifunctional metallophosphatase/5'-nucleotidase n=1 Tax=Photobacterium indicum TaxID=81447 RepID=A0A2T3L8A0_9GAMM|nr:bifunctional metallophosphatase/5'-nucleotidase [Photobacterium indicum]PSV46918.1 bifunctional metallophosphatase/5'-nucleotidase [Photobacterium indicum]
MNFSKPLIVLSIGLALAGCNSDSNSTTDKTQPAAPFDLTIAHVNDTHSSFDAVKSSFKVAKTTVYNEFGGHPRLLTKANAYKEEAKTNDDSILFLHGGDAWQGSAYFKLNDGKMNADILSQMGLDAMALGNHEFDLDNEKLNSFIGSINFPVLAANIDTSKDADLKDQTNLKPYVVYAFNGNEKELVTDLDNLPEGKQIAAIFGLVLDDMPNIAPNTGDVEFKDMVESAQSTVDMLKTKGINKVIAVTHIGNAVDLDVASKVNGIDLIVGGHSHTLLGDFTNLGLSNNGTYAKMVTNPDGKGLTCVVQAGEYAQAIGKTEVSFDAEGEITRCGGNNTLLTNDEFYDDAARDTDSKFTDQETASVVSFIEGQDNIAVTEEEAKLRAHINTKYKPAVDAAYGNVIAAVPNEINHERRPGDGGTDAHGSDVAPIVAAGQYYWASTTKVLDVLKVEGITKIDFSLVGAGGVRNSIPAGDFREGNVSLELLPFSSPMSIVPVKGLVVKNLITETVTATLKAGSHAGKFPYGGNLNYTFTETVAGTSGTLDSIEVNTGTLEIPVWTDLEDDTTYNVAINSYNATGSDGWTQLFTAQDGNSDRVDLAYVDGNLTAFPVERLYSVVVEDQTKYKVEYEAGRVLDCKDTTKEMECNTDAQAVIDYIKAEKPTLTPISNETVTLNRAE